MSSVKTDLDYMKMALHLAEQAFRENEVPVGALIVHQSEIIARAYNLTERLCDCTAHAEMQAITSACNRINSKYLLDCTLYVTLEPCCMCAGALFWSQIGRVVYGASDPKRGFETFKVPLHPKTNVSSGILKSESRTLLQDFFKKRRI